MNFKEIINELEERDFLHDYVIKKGSIPILFTAVHTMEQRKEDGSIKFSEPYTKAIALYLNKYFNVNCMIKINDTGLDSNRDNHDEFKTELINYIKDNNIKIVIDLHGAREDRDFDVEFGNLNNLTTDFSTIRELEEAFTENNINVVYNNPFKGGAITQYLFNLKDIDVVQIEINGRYRDNNNIEKLERLCNSLENFIKEYNEYINR